MYNYAPLLDVILAVPEPKRLHVLREIRHSRPGHDWSNCFLAVVCRAVTGDNSLCVGPTMVTQVLGISPSLAQEVVRCWDGMPKLVRKYYFRRMLPRQIKGLERAEQMRTFAVPEPPVVQIRKDLPVGMPVRKVMETLVLVLCVMLVV